ncbi:eotaxin-like [Engraulis encrasicolus]|uniref:eotaxin-like n=1 Tax=Engraulis encrasicolus TaxID=184585 RepID=UPI002FD0E456
MDTVLRVLYICLASGLIFTTLGEGAVPTACCMKYSKGVARLKNITEYHRQNAVLCPMEAVVITTVKNIKLCMDPNASWVKRAIKYIDSQKQRSTTVTTQSSYVTDPTQSGTATP